MSYDKKIVIIGAGVAGINAATTLVDSGYPGKLITIIDKGNDPYNRLPEETMEGMLGAGGWSDGKLTYHTSIGGQLSKYCGEEKAYELFDKTIKNFIRFHPKPEVIMKSDPQEEPDFIKPHFNLRLFPVYHIGSDYLHEIAKSWYRYLAGKDVNFMWQTEVEKIWFDKNEILFNETFLKNGRDTYSYDTLIFATGKSGIDLGKHLAEQYKLPTEPKSVQIGVRFEAPQKYFQKLIDVSYDFKLYQKHYPKIKFPEGINEEEYKKEFEEKTGLNFDIVTKQKQEENNVSIRSFCTNNNAAFVAVEETYGNISYNGHALKDESKYNGMTNFGILMEIKGIDNPFEWSREVVKLCQIKTIDKFDIKDASYNDKGRLELGGNVKVQKIEGLYFSPNKTRTPSKTSEGSEIKCYQIDSLDIVRKAMGKYFLYIEDFINDMNKVFEFGDDWGMYIPEVKYVSAEPLINYNNLSLIGYPNVYFVGDALSARGITVAGSQAIYVAESILLN